MIQQQKKLQTKRSPHEKSFFLPGDQSLGRPAASACKTCIMLSARNTCTLNKFSTWECASTIVTWSQLCSTENCRLALLSKQVSMLHLYSSPSVDIYQMHLLPYAHLNNQFLSLCLNCSLCLYFEDPVGVCSKLLVHTRRNCGSQTKWTTLKTKTKNCGYQAQNKDQEQPRSWLRLMGNQTKTNTETKTANIKHWDVPTNTKTPSLVLKPRGHTGLEAKILASASSCWPRLWGILASASKFSVK